MFVLIRRESSTGKIEPTTIYTNHDVTICAENAAGDQPMMESQLQVDRKMENRLC